jgi:hypothetical protein
MAPRWPQVNNGPEHINEHATYLREACNQMQAIDRGRQNQVPWNIVQPYIASTIALIGKVLRQPAMSEILQQIQDTAKCTQNIQRDITVIKSSVGLSTTPLNAATSFSGGRNANASWAQVAAQAKGSPFPPPPVPQGVHNTKTQPTVTAYKDRVVTIKLKDQGIVQRYRTHPAAWTRRQVETSIHDNAATKLVKVVAAHQLKSGDIQIFTSTTAEAIQLKENKGWIWGLGEQAELIVPTYGVIVHGISTSSINIKDQKATIQQMLADNYTVIPRTEISYVGWLTKESTLKRASSIVVEFTDPEMANAIIYAGMVWDGHIHQCQLYDRACRVKQCFRCYNYGHIGTQCNASQTCGYCTEQHETKHCRQKGTEGFTPRCAVCKGAHTAWSNTCPARRKELERVEQAKQARSIYWHVPYKENTARPRTYNTRNTSGAQEAQAPATTTPARRRTQRLQEFTAAETSALVDTETQTPPSANRSADLPIVQTPPQGRTPTGAQTPSEPMSTRVSVDPSKEDWATPAMQQEHSPQLSQLIDPEILEAQEPFSFTQVIENSQPQPLVYPLDGIDGAFGTQDANTWLDNMINNDDSEWMRDTTEDAPSPITSMATNTRTANGHLWSACTCPSHQTIYDDWPTHNAELTIAQCMRRCMYCGRDFNRASALRTHMRNLKYAKRGLRVTKETQGKWSSTTPA